MPKKLDTLLTTHLSQQEKEVWQEKAVRASILLSTLIRQAIAKTHTWTASDRSLIKEQTRQSRGSN